MFLLFLASHGFVAFFFFFFYKGVRGETVKFVAKKHQAVVKSLGVAGKTSGW